MDELPPPPPRRWKTKLQPLKLPPPPTEIEMPDPMEGAETVVPPPPWERPGLELAEAPAQPMSTSELDDFRAFLNEKSRRSCEALRIFQPLPEQERFFASDADERLAIGANRSGKTTPVVIEIARAALGCDPYQKYPKRDGIFILVAKDLGQCARVWYRKLFMAGAFQMIRDKVTKQWRPFRPDDPEDAERAEDAKAAPPLIPARQVKSISWENKKERQPRTVILHTGWEIWFFSSAGEWPQGVDVDGVALDEELERDGWYGEMAARLADRRKRNKKTGKVTGGKFMWSATPQAATVVLYELYLRAADEKSAYEEALEAGQKATKPMIEVYQFGLDENPYVTQEAKDVLKAKFANNEQEYMVRVEGRFAILGLRVYPEFQPRGVHAVPVFDIPHDWTRYAAIDPGRQVCAVLFAATGPPGTEFHKRLLIYDELYIRRCDAKTFARRFRDRIADQVIHQAVIDMRAGRVREIGSGIPVAEQYRRALEAEGVRFGLNDPHLAFLWSTSSVADSIKAGIEAVHGALHVDQMGRSRFAFMVEKLPNLVHEFESYLFRKHATGVVLDEPVQLNCHLMDDVRYLAALDLKYVKAKPRPRAGGYAVRALEAKRKRKAAATGEDAIQVW